MTIVIALVAAAMFGIGDFFGGSASRRFPAAGVLIFTSPVGLVPLVALTFVVHGDLTGRPSPGAAGRASRAGPGSCCSSAGWRPRR